MALKKPTMVPYLFELREDQELLANQVNIQVKAPGGGTTVDVPVAVRKLDPGSKEAKGAKSQEMAADIKAAQERMLEMDEEIKAKDEEITGLREALDTANQGAEEASKKIEAAESAKADLQTKVEQLEKDLAAAKKKKKK